MKAIRRLTLTQQSSERFMKSLPISFGAAFFHILGQIFFLDFLCSKGVLIHTRITNSENFRRMYIPSISGVVSKYIIDFKEPIRNESYLYRSNIPHNRLLLAFRRLL